MVRPLCRLGKCEPDERTFVFITVAARVVTNLFWGVILVTFAELCVGCPSISFNFWFRISVQENKTTTTNTISIAHCADALFFFRFLGKLSLSWLLHVLILLGRRSEAILIVHPFNLASVALISLKCFSCITVFVVSFFEGILSRHSGQFTHRLPFTFLFQDEVFLVFVDGVLLSSCVVTLALLCATDGESMSSMLSLWARPAAFVAFPLLQ